MILPPLLCKTDFTPYVTTSIKNYDAGCWLQSCFRNGMLHWNARVKVILKTISTQVTLALPSGVQCINAQNQTHSQETSLAP